MKTETDEGTLLSSKKEKFFSNFQGVMCGGVDGRNSGADKLLRSISLTGVWRPGGGGGGQVQGDHFN